MGARRKPSTTRITLFPAAASCLVSNRCALSRLVTHIWHRAVIEIAMYVGVRQRLLAGVLVHTSNIPFWPD
jgi:hypothetical protein